MKIYAPFTQGQIQALTEYQEHGKFHPFTCPNDMIHASGTLLVPYTTGWACDSFDCAYTQNWAWDWMTWPVFIDGY